MNKTLSSTFNEYITKIRTHDLEESIDNWDFYIDIEDPNNIVLLNRSNNTTKIKPLKPVIKQTYLNPSIRIIPVPLKPIKSGEEFKSDANNNTNTNINININNDKNNESLFTILNNKVYMAGVAIVCLALHII
jgi:hypothetical protein